MTISAIQARLARSLLLLTGQEVASAIGITKAPLHKFETEGSGISFDNRNLLRKFYEARGVEFLEYDGVRPLPKSTVQQLEGRDGFKIFMRDVLNVAETIGGDICVSGVDEREFSKWRGEFAEEYRAEMAKIREKSPFIFRILVKENDDFYTASTYAQYRAVPERFFSATPFYVYGDRLAMILFAPDDVTIYIIRSQKLADAQRAQFLAVWESLN